MNKKGPVNLEMYCNELGLSIEDGIDLYKKYNLRIYTLDGDFFHWAMAEEVDAALETKERHELYEKKKRKKEENKKKWKHFEKCLKVARSRPKYKPYPKAHPIEIGPQYCMNRYFEQNGKCVITEKELEFSPVSPGKRTMGNNQNPLKASIDRIDSEKGYIPGNIQILSWAANKMKGNLPDGFVKKIELGI